MSATKYFSFILFTILFCVIIAVSGCSGSREYSTNFYTEFYQDATPQMAVNFSIKGIGRKKMVATMRMGMSLYYQEELEKVRGNVYSNMAADSVNLSLSSVFRNDALDASNQNRLRFFDEEHFPFSFNFLEVILDHGDSTFLVGCCDEEIFFSNKFAHLSLVYPGYGEIYALYLDSLNNDYSFCLPRNEMGIQLPDLFHISELEIVEKIDKRYYLVRWRMLHGREFKMHLERKDY